MRARSVVPIWAGLRLTALCLLGLSGTQLVAQERGVLWLRGVVRSTESGEPVAGATVRLPGLRRVQVTGEDGAFAIFGVPSGLHRIVAEQLGRASDTVEVRIFGGEETVFVSLRLETRPVELPALDVEIERTFRNPRVAGFYHRMEKVRLGNYITREDLEHRDIVSNFRRIPGVQVGQCSRLGLPELSSNCWSVKFSGRGYSISDFTAGGGRGGCGEPQIYIDGNMLTPNLGYGNNAFNYLQSYPRYALEGIEVYRNPAMAPAQYRALGSACGVVLVWTRDRRGRG